MVHEIAELKWLLLPLYPFLIIAMFGLWLVVRAKKSRRVDVKVKVLGLSLELALDNTGSSCKKD